MSHNLCLSSNLEEFPLIGNPDAEDPGLGRRKIFSGNVGVVVEWYTRYCRDLTTRSMEYSGLLEDDCWPTPEWADPDPVSRHLAMIDAFLAFAPGAKFGAS